MSNLWLIKSFANDPSRLKSIWEEFAHPDSLIGKPGVLAVVEDNLFIVSDDASDEFLKSLCRIGTVSYRSIDRPERWETVDDDVRTQYNVCWGPDGWFVHKVQWEYLHDYGIWREKLG